MVHTAVHEQVGVLQRPRQPACCITCLKLYWSLGCLLHPAQSPRFDRSQPRRLQASPGPLLARLSRGMGRQRHTGDGVWIATNIKLLSRNTSIVEIQNEKAS